MPKHLPLSEAVTGLQVGATRPDRIVNGPKAATGRERWTKTAAMFDFLHRERAKKPRSSFLRSSLTPAEALARIAGAANRSSLGG